MCTFGPEQVQVALKQNFLEFASVTWHNITGTVSLSQVPSHILLFAVHSLLLSESFHLWEKYIKLAFLIPTKTDLSIELVDYIVSTLPLHCASA